MSKRFSLFTTFFTVLGLGSPGVSASDIRISHMRLQFANGQPKITVEKGARYYVTVDFAFLLLNSGVCYWKDVYMLSSITPMKLYFDKSCNLMAEIKNKGAGNVNRYVHFEV